jgi:Gas vesicle synthesis protein GvpL/GvpF
VPDDLLWAYAVVPAGTTLPAELTGIAGGVVQRVTADGLDALVGAVPAEEFAAAPLREHLNDLAWLERVAREHEAVLDQVLTATTIVPLRLCTIFDDADGVCRMLERERDALSDALGRLDGRQEWGVKLLVDGDRLAATAAPAGDQAQGEGGAAYLARRRHERAARESARALAVQLVDDADAALRAHAIAAVRLPAQNRELSGHSGDMVLNGAYLVDAGAVDDLRACIAELQDRHAELGARLELTGPWPPYNFVAGEQATQPA